MCSVIHGDYLVQEAIRVSAVLVDVASPMAGLSRGACCTCWPRLSSIRSSLWGCPPSFDYSRS